jgi:hypothetical protein
VTIPPKAVGLIEQIICASARRFIGTEQSTFTGLIPRLRGYIGAPDTSIYHHNHHYSHATRLMHRAVHGSDYMNEYPTLWEDI